MIYDRKYEIKNENEKCLIKKDMTLSFNLNGKDIKAEDRHKLFFTCEDASYVGLKNESGAEQFFMLIDDSLNYEYAENSRYCLDFSCEKAMPFAKRILKKIMWQPLVYGLYEYDDFGAYKENWHVGVYAKADNLKIEKDGFLHLRFDRWSLKEGVNPHDTTLAPDETVIIDISEGSYPYTEFEKDINIIRQETACVIVTLEGEKFSGNVYFENPYLTDFEDKNILPEFERGSLGLSKFAWLGQNLAKREWPHFIISVNGKMVFDGEVFLKIHRFSPIEIDLPDGMFKSGENTISITYKSDYLDVVPVLIGEILLLEKKKEKFSLLNCPESFVKGEYVRLLLEIEDDSIAPELISDDFSLCERVNFDGLNIQVMILNPLKEKNNLSFTLKYENEEKSYTVLRCVNKTENDVIAGSGDMIYIDASCVKSVCDYIKWYVANDTGKLVTIRPVYRWGGQRSVNKDVWDVLKKLCEKIGLFYVHISDGRDIPGIATNPSYEMLKGKNFLGRQLHERDGQLFYWSPNLGRPREIQVTLEEFYDLALRLGREMPETVEGAYRTFNLLWKDGTYSFRREFPRVPDMKECYDLVCKELKNLSKDNFIRHTGPAVMFKYFYENGFEWTGAETMDGATEMLLAFLRGASKAYNKEKYGVHLALQWSTFPHDTLQRYRRYLLSLYIPYMHGVSHINTEEGLWYIEARYAYFNRLSEACKKHRNQIQRFNKFINTHSRTGKFHTPFAFLHGRYDGWNGFYAWGTWGIPSMAIGDDSQSWRLLLQFYPLNTLESYGMVKTGCIPEDNDKPFGLLSGTPNGNADVVPIEIGELSQYSILCFAGYNAACESDLDRLYSFVENGGILICAWPHFSDTTLRSDIENYNLNILNHKITDMLSDGTAEFVSDSFEGKELKVCCNISKSCTVLEKTDNGKPLVCTYDFGKGQIVLVNSLYYPGHDSVFDIYDRVVREYNKMALEKEALRISCGNNVEYTVFEQENGTMHYYFTAVDWYNNSEDNRNAKFTLDGFTYEIKIKFGELLKLVTDGKRAVWPENDEAEVMSLSDGGFVSQGYGNQKFYVADGGELKEFIVCFEECFETRIDF